MKFKPHWTTNVAVVICLPILWSLGTWQFNRYRSSNERKDIVTERFSLGPATNADLPSTPDALMWRDAILEGTFVDVDPGYVTGRAEFGRPGFDVIQPFELTTGPIIMVNRGWIPMEDWQAHTQAIRPSGDIETIKGLLLPLSGDPKQPPIPADSAAPNRYVQPRGCNADPTPNFRAMAATMGVEPIDSVLISGERLDRPEQKVREPLPVTGYIARPKHIPHLEYSGQWFSFSIVLLCVWGWGGYLRGRRED